VTSGRLAPTSEGEFWESLNIACLKQLPLLYLIEDNGYAISVPIECQTAGQSISALVAGFPGLYRVGSGRPPISWRRTARCRMPRRIAERATARAGPCEGDAPVFALRFPTMSGFYRSPAERQAEAELDPVAAIPQNS